jgi:hypothetical protein
VNLSTSLPVSHFQVARTQAQVTCSASGYPTPYSIGNDGSLLNTVLNAWDSFGCDGTLRFTTGGAVMQLTQQYVISNRKLILDASGLSSNVVLLPASQSRFFQIQSSGNLTAKGITFNGVRINSTSPQWGGAIYLYLGSLYLESCVVCNNTIYSSNLAQGAGLFLVGATEVLLRDTIVRDNKILSESQGDGGGMFLFNVQRVIIASSDITGNSCEVCVVSHYLSFCRKCILCSTSNAGT